MTLGVRAKRWQKPHERPMPPQAQDGPAEGDRTVLVVVDSTRKEFGDVRATTLAALHHMGIPYEMGDLAKGSLSVACTTGRALVLLPQERCGRSLDAGSAEALCAAMKKGVGLCSLDPWLMLYPRTLVNHLGLSAGSGRRLEKVVCRTNRHYITAWRERAEEVPFRSAVTGCPLGGKGRALLAHGGDAFVRAGRVGAAKFVWCGLSPGIWLHEYLGHGWGLDDLFWKCIVWVAKKPFAMKAMPPFVSMRYDDCSGHGGLWWLIGYANSLNQPHPEALKRIINLEPGGRASVLNQFNYVKILNEFGWRPEISLFVEQVSDEDWAHLKTIHDARNVQVSSHGSFTDGFGVDGKWHSDFILYKGVECLTKKGVEFRSNLAPKDVHVHMEMKKCVPYRILRYPDRTVDQRIRRLDAIWKKRGITPGKTQNMHWRNVPSNALRFLKERGQTFTMCSNRSNYAHIDPEGYKWRMAPYGDRGMFLDYMPIPVDARGVNPGDFFNYRAHVAAHRAGDPISRSGDYCRCEKDAIPGLTTHADAEVIARTITKHTRFGLQSLFFGHPVTHEMNLAVFSNDQWRDILRAVEKGLARYPKMFVLHDEIAFVARSKCETHIDRVRAKGRQLCLELSGKAQSDVWLYVFHDRGDDCTQRFHKVGAFEGTKRVRV